MKKLSVLLMAVLASGTMFTSCSKDDDEGSGTLNRKWNYYKEGAMVGNDEMLVDYTGNETGCSKDYIEFNENGTAIDVDYDSFDTPCEAFTTNATYTRTGDQLTVTIEGFDYTVTIKKLTSSELKIQDADGFITVFRKN